MIGIYNPHWHIAGGGERVGLSLAEKLNATVISWFDLSDMIKYFGLNGVSQQIIWYKNIWKVSREYESLILIVTNRPILHRCKRYSVIMQLPLNKPKWTFSLRGTLRNIMSILLVRQARKAETIFVYSNFVKNVLKKNWELDCEVLYPQVKAFKPGKKKNIILSVGRFFRNGHNKRYDVLTRTFKLLDTDWEYHIVGSCNDFEYVNELKRKNPDVFFHVNESHKKLSKLYSEAKIFWHAAGYGATCPEQMEHFGISTVEAMSAGCVPLVFSAGGQQEIVREEFTWYLPLELLIRTKNLIDGTTIKGLSRLAISDSKRFTNTESVLEVCKGHKFGKCSRATNK